MPHRTATVLTIALVLAAAPTWTAGAAASSPPEAGAPAESDAAGKRGARMPVTFTLDRPGYVTLVIEDAEGDRVRNLLNDTYFEAGEHTVYWDGYDVGEKQDKESHYDVRRRRVAPGTYRVRGLVHDDVDLVYRLSVQSPGTPPWHTADGSGAWLADHSPPIEALFLPDGSPHGDRPQVLLSATVAEAGHCVMWVTEEGEKLYGSKFAGWRGPIAMARDVGTDPNPAFYAYGLVNNRGKLELYGMARDAGAARPYVRLMQMECAIPKKGAREEGAKFGLVVRDGVACFSRPPAGEVVFYDTRAGKRGKEIGTVALEDPRGMAFGPDGGLYLVAGTRLRRYAAPNLAKAHLGEAETLPPRLQDPRKLTVGPKGNVYASDWGEAHQVRVFAPDGKPVRTIGEPGGKQFGTYDERRMHRPGGVAIDSRGHLWVAEVDYAPKRISQWNAATGEFVRAWYGPPRYGGGGHLDLRDPTRFTYPSNLQGIAFRLDWDRATSRPEAVYALQPHTIGRVPGTTVYVEDRRYMVNPLVGPAYFKARDAHVYLWRDDGTVQIVGGTVTWGRKAPDFQAFVEKDPALAAKVESVPGHFKGRFYVWSDLNLDGVPQADEVQGTNLGQEPVKRYFGGASIGPDLAITTTAGAYVPPPTFTDQGVPVWDLEKVRFFADHAEHLADVLRADDGFFVYTMGGYTNPRVVRGYRDGRLRWKINGVGGPGRGDPVARYKGQLVNAQRTIGYPVKPAEGEAGPLFALNSYHGSVYVLTTDGLYVTDLLGDARTTPRADFPQARPGMVLDDVTFHEEHFWPALDQVADGSIYLTAGHPSSNIFEVRGLDSVRRVGPWTVEVTADAVADLPAERVLAGEGRKVERTMTVPLRPAAPAVDGLLDDWRDAEWVEVDPRRGVRAAVAVHGDTLYAAWQTDDPALLANSVAEGWRYAFATGGGLDLMVRTDPDAPEPKRRKHHGTYETAAEGDVRLFVTRAGDAKTGKVLAVRFQQVGGRGEEVVYDSPIGRVTFDAVADVSGRVRLAQAGGNYEVAVPLEVLGLRPKAGTTTLGDVGVLVGDGRETRARLYWSNRAAQMVSDIPSEARLAPHEWGIWRF